jgi:hypothetical protein
VSAYHAWQSSIDDDLSRLLNRTHAMQQRRRYSITVVVVGSSRLVTLAVSRWLRSSNLGSSEPPLFHVRMIPRSFRKEIVLASFAAETQTPMVIVDKTKLSPTICALVLQLSHEDLSPNLRLITTARQAHDSAP